MTRHEATPYIEHIKDAIKDIESFTKNLSKEKFLNSKLRQNAVIRQLEVIGEATKNVPESFRKKYDKIEWRKMAGTRDKITHHYFGIDLNAVWDMVKEDLPILKKQIKQILDEVKLEELKKEKSSKD